MGTPSAHITMVHTLREYNTHTHTSEKSSNSSHMSRSPLSDAFQQENNSSCFPNTHFMAFFTSLGLFSQKFAHVIASFIVAPQPIDAAVQGHLGQLAFKSSFSSEFLFCFLLSPVHVFFCPPPTSLNSIQSVLIDILFLLYFQGDVGPPGPPGPVSTMQPILPQLRLWRQETTLHVGLAATKLSLPPCFFIFWDLTVSWPAFQYL